MKEVEIKMFHQIAASTFDNRYVSESWFAMPYGVDVQEMPRIAIFGSCWEYEPVIPKQPSWPNQYQS